MDEIHDRLHSPPARRQLTEPLPGFIAELVGQAEPAGHDKAQHVVRERCDGCFHRIRLDHISRRGEQQLRLVSDPRAAGIDREPFASIRVQVDVAVMVRGRIPLLASDQHPWQRTRSDLNDRRDRVGGLELELASDGECQRVERVGLAIAPGRDVGHPTRGCQVQRAPADVSKERFADIQPGVHIDERLLADP